MLTVTMVARRCGVSRTTLLYYEAQGLLRKAPRTSTGNYRAYDERDVQRVEQVRQYRRLGMSVREIRTLLEHTEGRAASILEPRLAAIDAEVEALRHHQRAILGLLRQSRTFRRRQMMSKDKWVAIMRKAGLTEEQMHRWHAEFEKDAPDDHQAFLEYLRIEPAEISRIRQASARG